MRETIKARTKSVVTLRLIQQPPSQAAATTAAPPLGGTPPPARFATLRPTRPAPPTPSHEHGGQNAGQTTQASVLYRARLRSISYTATYTPNKAFFGTGCQIWSCGTPQAHTGQRARWLRPRRSFVLLEFLRAPPRDPASECAAATANI